MTSRFRIVLLTALVVFFGATSGPALACISVHIGAYPESAQAGDTVRYSVSNLESGAHYTISFNGTVIANASKGDAPVAGTFTMPDLGTVRRTVLLSLTFDHSEIDGSQGNDPKWLTYEPTAAPRPPPPPPPAPPPQAPVAPPPATQLQHPVRHPVSRVRSQPRAHAARRAIRARRGPRSPVHVARTAGVAAPRPPVHAASIARVAAPRRAVASRPAAPIATSLRAVGRHESHQRIAPVARPTWAPQEGRAGPRAAGEGTARSSERGWNPGWVVLALAALLVFGLNGANGWRRLRRRPPPIDDEEASSLEIEAELQELIAEERAKREFSPRS